jgi:hypothetical protein
MALVDRLHTDAGVLAIYEKSILFSGISMYLKEDPYKIPGLLEKLPLIIDAAFALGQAQPHDKMDDYRVAFEAGQHSKAKEIALRHRELFNAIYEEK